MLRVESIVRIGHLLLRRTSGLSAGKLDRPLGRETPPDVAAQPFAAPTDRDLRELRQASLDVALVGTLIPARREGELDDLPLHRRRIFTESTQLAGRLRPTRIPDDQLGDIIALTYGMVSHVDADRDQITAYPGQPYGELFDLQEDPGQLYNLWDRSEAQHRRRDLLIQLMEELALTDCALPRRLGHA